MMCRCASAISHEAGLLQAVDPFGGRLTWGVALGGQKSVNESSSISQRICSMYVLTPTEYTLSRPAPTLRPEPSHPSHCMARQAPPDNAVNTTDNTTVFSQPALSPGVHDCTNQTGAPPPPSLPTLCPTPINPRMVLDTAASHSLVSLVTEGLAQSRLRASALRHNCGSPSLTVRHSPAAV